MGKPSVARLRKKGNVQGLIEALDQLTGAWRTEAIEALGVLGDPSAIPALTRFLNDAHSKVAIRALARIGGVDAAIALLDALGDDRWDVATLAADVLSGASHPRLVEAMLGVIEAHRGRSDDAFSRRLIQTLEVLASTELGAPRALDAIVQSEALTAAEQDKIGEAFRRAVTGDPKHAAALLLDADAAVRERMADLVGKHQPQSRVFDDAVMGAIHELEARGDVESLNSLCRIRNRALALAAVEAIGRLGDPRGLNGVFYQLYEAQDANLSAARAAVLNISRRWDESSIDRGTMTILVHAFQGGPYRRQRAFDLCLDIGDAVTAKILKGLADAAFKRQIREEREVVADALRHIKRPRDLVQFCAMANPVRGAARVQLSERGPTDFDLESALLGDDVEAELVAMVRFATDEHRPEDVRIRMLTERERDQEPVLRSLANALLDDIRQKYKPIGNLVITAATDPPRMLELARKYVDQVGNDGRDVAFSTINFLMQTEVWDEEVARRLRERIPEVRHLIDSDWTESDIYKHSREIFGPWLASAEQYVLKYSAVDQ